MRRRIAAVKASDLVDLVNEECVVIESGQGHIAVATAFREDEERIYAELKTIDSRGFTMNRIRLNDEPAIASWDSVTPKPGTSTTISTRKNQVFREPNRYLHFSLPVGGVRLFFIEEYVRKVRQQDAEGWDFDTMIDKATSR